MKRTLLLSLFLFSAIASFSRGSDKYWVGGTGLWTDKLHWSTVSGGKGGTEIPRKEDRVFFDESSFQAKNQKVTLPDSVFCKDFICTGSKFKPEFISSGIKPVLQISGSFTLPTYKRVSFHYKGTIVFSSSSSETIDFNNNLFEGTQIVFNGSGTWNLESDLNASSSTSLVHLKGTLNTHNFNLFFGNYIREGNEVGELSLGESNITIYKDWKIPVSSSMNISSDKARFLFTDTRSFKHFDRNAYRIGNNIHIATSCNNPPLTVVVTSDSVICNGQSNGAVHAVVSGGSPPYNYSWSPSGCITPDCFGLPPQTYLVSVGDANPADGVSCSIGVSAPAPVVIILTIPVPISCNGGCNGTVKSTVNGGCQPYTYSWLPGNQTTTSITSQCTGTYTLQILDSKACPAQAIKNLLQPAVINPIGTYTVIDCFGACDGIASVTPTGGTGAYTYAWTGPGAYSATTATITNLCPGNYTCSVTDANGCVAPTTFVASITQPAAPLSSTFTTGNNPLACSGQCNASTNVTMAGGTPGYTYSWTPVAGATSSLNSLCIGNYTLDVTDLNGCVFSTVVPITGPPPLIGAMSHTDVNCNGGATGTATVTPSGGTGAYTYSWSPGAPTGQFTTGITGLIAQEYTVSLTDNMGCNTIDSVAVHQASLISITITPTMVTCFGAANGIAVAGVSGGTGAYTYSWSPGAPIGQFTNTISGLAPNTYTVLVTDAFGCTMTQTIVITEPALLVANASATPQSCASIFDGTATANPTGGTGAYTYSWSPGAATTQTLTNLSAGNYTVTVTDASGCVQTQVVTVTSPLPIIVTLTGTNISCNGACDGTASASVSGGTAPYIYAWTPGASPLTGISSLCANTYTCTVTDANNCPQAQTIIITEPAVLLANTTATPASCAGLCTGTLCAAPTGGTMPYTYSWSPIGVTTACVNNVCAGTYTATVQDANGCSNTQVVIVTAPTAVFPNVSKTDIVCSGQCNGTATSAASGGTGVYTYSWTPAGSITVGQGTSSISSLCAGSYTCQVTDANGCTGTQIITIIQPSLLNAFISSTTPTCGTCQGVATVNVSGGTGGYNYSWNSIPTQSGPTATNLCVGTYTVTVTDVNSCSASAVAVITQTVILSISTTSFNLSCHNICDGAATANTAGGLAPYAYTWAPAPPVGQGTQNVSGLCAGTYTVTAVDANGCFNSATAIFTNPSPLSPTITPVSATCNSTCNGSISTVVSGGTGLYTYSWAPGGQTTSSIASLCSGTYTLTVTDANGCDSITPIILAAPPPILPNSTLTSPTSCASCDGSISVAPSGGAVPYTYSWSPAEPATPTVNNLCAGLYTVTITDNFGCDTVVPIGLNSPTGPNSVLTPTAATCNGVCNGSVSSSVSGGNPPYVSYTWIPAPAVGQGTLNASSLCAGAYTFEVIDNIGCIQFTSTAVTAPPVLVLTPVITNVSCNGANDGSITVNMSGGTIPYTYTWTSGQATNSISGLAPGNYTFTGTDANGCSQTVIYPITQPGIFTVAITSTNVTCNGFCNGSASAVITGGTSPFAYSWSNGALVSNVSNLCPTTYTVVATDVHGCTATQTSLITEPAPFTDIITSTNATCFGVCNGTAIAVGSGGTAPYIFTWAPGNQIMDTLTSMCAGNYSATGSDAHGCVAIASVIITEPPAINITLTPTNATCSGVCNGSIHSVTSGGVGAYTYSWSPGVNTLPDYSGLCPGTWTLTVTDGNSCNVSQTANISQPAPLLAGSSGTNPGCNGSCNGTATASPVGGTAPYTYSWSPTPGATTSISSLCAGAYTVTVNDVNGCVNAQVVNVVDPAAISGTFAVGNSNCGVCNGTMGIIPAGGTMPYTYSWSTTPSQTTANLNSLCAGIYLVKVTDVNGCSSTIAAPPLNNTGGPTADTIHTTNPTCFMTCNGTANCTLVVGGTPAFTYAWYDSLNNNLAHTLPNISNLCAGGYFLKVTDVNSCVYIQRVELASPPPVVANPAVHSPSCSGICDGKISLAPTGGTGAYTYSWTSPVSTAATVTNLCPGPYTVQITDANLCASSFTITLAPTVLVSGTSSHTNPTCFGVCSGTATVTMTSGTAPYTYQWSDPLAQTSPTATGLCAGNYSVTVFDAHGCNIVQADTITTPAALSATPTINGALCGVCNGSISVVASGGIVPYTYNWSNGSHIATASNLCAGLYSLGLTDANGCSTSPTYPISNTPGPGPSILNITNINCNGICNGSATVTPVGGTAPYNYSWTVGGQTVPSIVGQCAGLYYIEVIDKNGCIRIDSATITQPPIYNTHQIVIPTSCALCNGSISLNPTGGSSPYTYSWTGALPPLSAQNNLCVGVDSVVITDATGCAQTFSMVINSSNSPSIVNSLKNIVCNGSCNGRDSVVASGGSGGPYTYLWAPSPGVGQNTPNGSSMCPGAYIVQVTDGSGCANSVSFTVTQPSAISFSAPQLTNLVCNSVCNGKATLNVSGGSPPYLFSWSPGSGSTTLTDSMLCAGNYTLHLTDNNACIDSQMITITSPPALTFTNTMVAPPCDNVATGSIITHPAGGVAPYAYSWSGPSGFTSTNMNLFGLLGGDYTLTVKDTNGCQQVIADTLKPLISMEANAGPNKSFCTLGAVMLDGTLSVNASSYAWYLMPGFSPLVGATMQTMVTPPAGVTTYALITSNSGCTDTAQVTVTSNPPPVVFAGVDQSILTNGSAVIGGNPTCPTGVLYHWTPSATVNDSSNANPDVHPFTTTVYTVTVTDANGCMASDTVMITVLPELIISNGITPNGDGVNDRWAIDNIHKFPNNVVEIYNRWGELLFQEKNYQDDWDGTYKGQPLPVGTYYYLVNLNDPLYKTKYSGSITIMR